VRVCVYSRRVDTFRSDGASAGPAAAGTDATSSTAAGDTSAATGSVVATGLNSVSDALMVVRLLMVGVGQINLERNTFGFDLFGAT
jgi:hypothetical protein